MGHQMLLITVLVLLVMGAVGYWKGFLKMALSMAALVLTLIIGMLLHPYVSSFLQEKTPVYHTIRNAITEAMGTDQEAVEDLGQEQNEKIEKFALPESWKQSLISNYSENTLISMGAETFSEYISASLAGMIVSVIAFVLTFIIVFLALHILMVAFDLIGKVPVIHGINKLAGAVTGFLLGFLVLWLFHMLVASAAATGAEWASHMMGEIQESKLLTFLYNGGLFSKLAELFLS